MTTNQGVRLSRSIRSMVEEMSGLCKGLDEETACRVPADGWSPKQILSHLCGPEGVGIKPMILTGLEQDPPRLDIEAENPFFTGKRIGMTLSDLLGEFKREYAQITDLAGGLGEYHLKDHIHHMREILQALGIDRPGQS